MPANDLRARLEKVRALILEQKALCDAATPGPWQVWDGWQYSGGGRDLCIGAGPDWLANMDHRTCQALQCHQGVCKLNENADIVSTSGCRCTEECNFQDHISTEQRANADMIALARTWWPKYIAYALAMCEEAKNALDVADSPIGRLTSRQHEAEADYFLSQLERYLMEGVNAKPVE